jgi:hypothetical protein
LDDTQSVVRELCQRFDRERIGYDLLQVSIEVRSPDPVKRRKEYAEQIIARLSEMSQAANEPLYLFVDNYMPEAHIGREIARSCEAFWIVIVTGGDSEELSINNPKYLGWTHKRELTELGDLFCDVLRGKVQADDIRLLLQEGKQWTILDRFTVLKHRLENLFVPTLVDLQSVCDLWYASTDEERAFAELREIFDQKPNGKKFYQNLLRQAREVAFGRTPGSEGYVRSDNVIEEPFLERGTTISETISSIVVDAGPESSLEWLQFCRLLGVEKVDRQYIPIIDSPIDRFCKALDLIRDGDASETPSIPSVLECFRSGEFGAQPSEITNFSDWFSAITASMDRIREHLNPQPVLA